MTAHKKKNTKNAFTFEQGTVSVSGKTVGKIDKMTIDGISITRKEHARLRETLFPERRYRVRQEDYSYGTILVPEIENEHGVWKEMYEHIDIGEGQTIPNSARTIVPMKGSLLDRILRRSYKERILRAVVTMTQWIQEEHARRSPPNTTGLVHNVTVPPRK